MITFGRRNDFEKMKMPDMNSMKNFMQKSH